MEFSTSDVRLSLSTDLLDTSRYTHETSTSGGGVNSRANSFTAAHSSSSSAREKFATTRSFKQSFLSNVAHSFFTRNATPHWTNKGTFWEAQASTPPNGTNATVSEQTSTSVPEDEQHRSSAGRKPHSFIAPIKHNTSVALEACWTRPAIILVPLFLGCLVVGFGVWGVIAAANGDVNSKQNTANGIALQVAANFELQMSQSYSPTLVVAQFVRDDPLVPVLLRKFPKVAADLMTSQAVFNSSLKMLQLSPQGVVQGIYPFEFNKSSYGINTLNESNLRAGALRTIRNANLTLSVTNLVNGGNLTVLARLPVFIANVSANETWNATQWTVPTNCSICYNNVTLTKFWGFVTAAIYVDAVVQRQDSPFVAVLKQGYLYRMTASAGNGTVIVVAGSSVPPEDPIVLHVQVFPGNPSWNLELSPVNGWVPTWRAPLIAVVVVTAVFVVLLTFSVLYSRYRYSRLLKQILPKKAIRKLQRGQVFYESFANVTILFSDIVSYTNISATLTPLQVVSLLNEVYSIYDELVSKWNLYKVETIGDAFVVCGGCPEVEDPLLAATRVANLAQDMIARTASFVSSAGLRIRIRVGIHSGPIVAAVIGKQMPRYSLFGDTVNTASRMESHGSPMRVHCSSCTAALLSGKFTFETRGAIEIKGKGRMSTFFLGSHEEDQTPSSMGQIEEIMPQKSAASLSPLVQ